MKLLHWLNSGDRTVLPVNTDSNYADPQHTDELGGVLLVCRRCGAVVPDDARDMHTTWHDQLGHRS